jgi:hypothetical protein
MCNSPRIDECPDSDDGGNGSIRCLERDTLRFANANAGGEQWTERSDLQRKVRHPVKLAGAR